MAYNRIKMSLQGVRTSVDVRELRYGVQNGSVQPVRVKYIKFTSAMDVALLELIQLHKPISAKHGTRLAMWERVARDFGAQVFDNPLACKWQICRCHDCFTPDTLHRTPHCHAIHGGVVVVECSTNEVAARPTTRRGPPFDGSSSGLDATAAQLLRIVEQKLQVDMDMRRRDQQLRAQELNMQHQLIDYLDTSRHTRRQRRRIISKNSGATSTDVAVNDEDDEDDGGAAARLLELLKHKMQFDMAHHAAEMELRADEVELQRRVLAFLARC
ncbi:hypothetical protein DYB32_000384 [Aphanomyces invadans]|uniref:Uncharacterized protein n=1 Tax=Aphanomyces invadans TaxID=157072 RepID=A0A418BA93_9STRA|nr:hypothetical protein DYB32_000384 [Aphanomyces invadans]